MATRLFYSGLESGNDWITFRKHADYGLMSYYYLRDMKDELKRRKDQHPDVKLFIDSGAHTLQKEQGVQWSVDEWKRYLDDYALWLQEHRDYIFCAAELDVQNQVGNLIIPEWRKQYFEPLEYSGLQIVYVWHPTFDTLHEGFDEWEKMCRRYRFIGFSHAVFAEGWLDQLMGPARRYCNTVHGFAITSYKAVRDGGLAYADSTTWLARGRQFNDWCVWDGQRMYTLKDDAAKEAHRGHIEGLGFNFDAMMGDDYNERCGFCLKEFRRMEDAFRESEKLLPYWKVRTPYPQQIDRMAESSLQRWGDFFNIEGLLELCPPPGEVEVSPLDALRAISCVQNHRVAEYLPHKALYDAAMTSMMGGALVDISDEEGMSRVAKKFNGSYVERMPAAKSRETLADFKVEHPLTGRKDFGPMEREFDDPELRIAHKIDSGEGAD